jgi:cysteine-rich repeat protein
MAAETGTSTSTMEEGTTGVLEGASTGDARDTGEDETGESSVCGNGIIEGCEHCDDGVRGAGDCPATCRFPAGTELSTWFLAGRGSHRAAQLVPDPAGGYYVTGRITTGDGLDILVLRIGVEGEIEWERIFDGPGEHPNIDAGTGLVASPDGGVFVVGRLNVHWEGVINETWHDEIWVARFDREGEVLWTQQWGQDWVSGWTESRSILLLPDDTLLVTGSEIYPETTDLAMVLLNYSQDGELLSVDWLLDDDVEYLHHARPIVSHDGALLLARGVHGTTANGDHIRLQKRTLDGSVLWEDTFGSHDEWGETRLAGGVAEGPEGEVVVVATVRNGLPGTPNDVVARKYTPDGELLWEWEWTSGGSDAARGVAIGHEGDVFVQANANEFANGDIRLLQLSPDGALKWEEAWNGLDPATGSSHDYGAGLVLERCGILLSTGYSNAGPEDGYDIVVRRLAF